MGKDKGKKEAEKQARERERQAQERLTVASQPTPVQSFLDQENLDFLNASSGKSGPLDVLNMRGMAPYAAQFAAESAEEQAGQERMGEGLVTMGSAGADPNLSALVKQNRADRRRQVAGTNLARNFAAKNAEVRGSAMPLMALTQNRNMGLAGLTAGRADQSWDTFFKLKSQPGFWEKMLLTGWGNASSAAGAAMGGA